MITFILGQIRLKVAKPEKESPAINKKRCKSRVQTKGQVSNQARASPDAPEVFLRS